MALADFITADEQQRVVDAIAAAEKLTSGEIRVHITPRCRGDVFSRAVAVFHKLGMENTVNHNGVLVYVAFKSHKFAIVGDSGIDRKVPAGFWDAESATLAAHLKRGEIADGLCEVIKHAGRRLAEYFPVGADDMNELSNEISYSDEGQ